MASNAPRTRKKTGTKFSDFLGTGRDFLVSELPTLRDVLRYVVLLREQHEENARNITVREVAREVVPVLINQWVKANALFKPPVIVSDKTIIDKIVEAWSFVSDVVSKSVSKTKKEKFIIRLDKLFDIVTCKCQITSCSDFDCSSSCSQEAHISCSCQKDRKIPVKDIPFIKGQRDKVGSRGPYQIAGVVMVEHIRHENRILGREGNCRKKKSQVN